MKIFCVHSVLVETELLEDSYLTIFVLDEAHLFYFFTAFNETNNPTLLHERALIANSAEFEAVSFVLLYYLTFLSVKNADFPNIFAPNIVIASENNDLLLVYGCNEAASCMV